MSDSCCQSSTVETTAPTHECCGGTGCSDTATDARTAADSTATLVA